MAPGNTGRPTQTWMRLPGAGASSPLM